MLRKPEDIKRFLQQQKEINQRKKERELKRYRKAQEQTKKQLKKVSKKVEQTPEKPLKFTYSLTIYQSPLIERFPDEEDLYHTREEIDNDESGSINWEVWDKLIDKYKNNR